MKKWTILMVVLMVVCLAMAFITDVNAEEIVKDHSYGEVYDWIEEWAKLYGYEEFVDYNNKLDENACYHGYGVIDNSDFVDVYGVDYSNDSCIEVLAQHYDGLKIEITTVGFYEGYSVFLMKASANEPIGYGYWDDERVDYYSGEMLYMICE